MARFLEAHPKVAEVRHPGLPSHPQHALARRQMSGCSSLFGFVLASEDIDRIKRFFDAVALFRRGVSWGGHESLIYAPLISYLKEQPPERLQAVGLSPGDIRLSVGLEHAGDLIADLEQALDAL